MSPITRLTKNLLNPLNCWPQHRLKYSLVKHRWACPNLINFNFQNLQELHFLISFRVNSLSNLPISCCFSVQNHFMLLHLHHFRHRPPLPCEVVFCITYQEVFESQLFLLKPIISKSHSLPVHFFKLPSNSISFHHVVLNSIGWLQF